MGIILDFIINIFGELFLTDSAERLEKKRAERQKQRTIKRLVRHFEWFEQLYRVEGNKRVIDQDDEIRTTLLDREYVRQLDLNLAEREAFAKLLSAKAAHRMQDAASDNLPEQIHAERKDDRS
ncbi:hypothetical protein XYCOK13_24320 [Xylanibacillus composti]|uniref:Uncharacterized protein n=1 Tax=Xylanibacillus composti TaxID=1572762 RepID=A0A8J4H6J0_9BACL|nr:hypothetical protein [Xylanibacillus composti]GIQ69608.1 hypothetical protein XYCOK13_24320 [Xylanibacillus composti]